MTLRFVGSVEDTVLGRLRSELKSVRAEPFALALGGLGTFGGRRPRVVWLSVESGAEQLGGLAEQVEQACWRASLEPEERPFRAHLTLARAASRDGAVLPELPPPPSLEPWLVGKFVLYESRLGRGPAVYVPLAEFALRG